MNLHTYCRTSNRPERKEVRRLTDEFNKLYRRCSEAEQGEYHYQVAVLMGSEFRVYTGP